MRDGSKIHTDGELEEVKLRQETYKYLFYLSLVFALIFFLLIVDMLLLDWSIHTLLGLVQGEWRGTTNFYMINIVNMMLFFVYVSVNLYFIYDFLTDKLGEISCVPFWPEMVRFLGWNIICIGTFLGVINV